MPPRPAPPAQPVPPPPGPSRRKLDVSALESWLWEAACVIRGPLDAPKFKDYILPLIFLKRLSDVFDDELAHLAHDLGGPVNAAKLVEADHKLVRVFVPEEARWGKVGKRTTKVGEGLTDAFRAIARANEKLAFLKDIQDYNATTSGQRIIDDDRLIRLIDVLNNPSYRLGLDDVEPDILGRAYEYLLRKFAEGQGQSAGEFYTPREVGITMARILDPKPGEAVYDPCCGSGGLLVKCHLRLLETRGEERNGRLKLPNAVAPVKVFGQEINPGTFTLAKMNAALHDIDAEIELGDSMRHPSFTDKTGKRLRTFDVVTANPMWNQKFDPAVYENDAEKYARFDWGAPPGASADWGWIQHMLAYLGPKGRMAVVLDSGAVSRGSGNQGSNKERDLRKRAVDADLVEAVLLLPDNLFYNTTAPGVVMVLNRAKRHPREVLLINGAELFAKGRPKNYLPEEHVDRIATAYRDWKPIEEFVAVATTAEVVKNDYNLSPTRYVAAGAGEEVLPLEEAVVLLREAEEERAEADRALNDVLAKLGFKG